MITGYSTAVEEAQIRALVDTNVRDLNITENENMAFSNGLNRVNGTRNDGMKIGMWWRSTTCYRKIAGRWMVTHEHSSIPFDAEGGKPSLNSRP